MTNIRTYERILLNLKRVALQENCFWQNCEQNLRILIWSPAGDLVPVFLPHRNFLLAYSRPI